MSVRAARQLKYFEAANREYQDQLDYYAKVSPGTERAFAVAIKTAESLILANPRGFARLDESNDLRIVVVRRFPFRLLYTVRGEDVIVVAVAHTARAIERFSRRI